VKEEFKRINFFKGFFTQSEDWQMAQEYHLEKRKFHNRFLHTPGIVFGCLDNLKVTGTKKGTSLYVAPGYAIDGEGRDLYLSKPEKVSIAPQSYRPPKTVYVIIRYHEEKIDLRPNAANPEYSDYAFFREWPLVEITTDEPDNHRVIELARIALSQDATRVRDPEDLDSPGPNEIDLRYIRRAGVETGPMTLSDLGEVVREAETTVVASKEPIPSKDDTNVLIEKIRGKDAHRFYLVSAYPFKEASIRWRIESRFNKDTVEYRLFFKNFSNKAVKVFYKVYRLNLPRR